jgi:hexosaminidase
MIDMKSLPQKLKNCFLAGLAIILFAASVGYAAQRGTAVIPKPQKITFQKGHFFTIKPDTVILADKAATPTARQLQNAIAQATGYSLTVKPPHVMRENYIIIILGPDLTRLGSEGYHLMIMPKKVVITAADNAGAFYAFQTLRQLLPVQFFSKTPVKGIDWKIPCVLIEDYPRFAWRGAMLDLARYYMPKEFVRKFIDLMAMHKMNSLQLHLTDDQGWRIEIKKYPRLTEVGAWRKESIVGHLRDKPRKYDGKPHGGFYTQDDLREIVAYARDRHIRIVPEVEMPGHAQSAIAAYPELGNTGKKLGVSVNWGVHKNIFNADEKTILFLQDVLTEVLEIFPSEFIHIGGDEANKDQWKASSEIQARIKELGLKNEDELQSYFIKRMDNFLVSKGRRLIGWDEILEGGLAPNATVMSWRGTKGGIAAARAGHDVVMAPTKYTYFDYYQSKNKKKEPLAIGGFLPLRETYEFEPIPKELTPEQAKHILGAQGQLWTEYIPNPKKAEYMGFPRYCALAELVWTKPEHKDYPDFVERLKGHLKRLDILGVNYRPLD